MKHDKLEHWIPNSLKIVVEAIDTGCGLSGRFTLNNQLVSLLKDLTYEERHFVANYFCQIPWNVSSVKVLGILNRMRILTATEYILSQTDSEHIQLVLNDFLETEFHLLANLIISGHFDLMVGSRISEYVSESVRRLYSDLLTDSKLNNLEYLAAIKGTVPVDLYEKFVINHLNIILPMHKCTMQGAFASLSKWLEKNQSDYEFVENFYKKAVAGMENEIVKTLFSISSGAHFIGWRNYLLLLGMSARTQCGHFIKKWLKDRVKLVAETGSKDIMAHLLLSIRVVLHFQDDRSETYATWYKQQIGDMKFVLSVPEFQTVIKVLTDLVPIETDKEYLQIHVKTSISPPAMCSELCRDYKLLCRTRIADVPDCSESLEMVDDDDLLIEVN